MSTWERKNIVRERVFYFTIPIPFPFYSIAIATVGGRVNRFYHRTSATPQPSRRPAKPRRLRAAGYATASHQEDRDGIHEIADTRDRLAP